MEQMEPARLVPVGRRAAQDRYLSCWHVDPATAGETSLTISARWEARN